MPPAPLVRAALLVLGTGALAGCCFSGFGSSIVTVRGERPSAEHHVRMRLVRTETDLTCAVWRWIEASSTSIAEEEIEVPVAERGDGTFEASFDAARRGLLCESLASRLVVDVSRGGDDLGWFEVPIDTSSQRPPWPLGSELEVTCGVGGCDPSSSGPPSPTVHLVVRDAAPVAP